MKSSMHILGFTAVIFFFSACQKDKPGAVNMLSSDHNPRIALNSNLIANQIPRAMVSNTIVATDGSQKIVRLNSANVYLYEGGNVVDTLYPDLSGTAKTPFDFIGKYSLKEGKNYEIKAFDSKYPTASGNTTLPKDNYSVLVNSYSEQIITDLIASYRVGKLNVTLTQTSDDDVEYVFVIEDQNDDMVFSVLCTENIDVFTSNFAQGKNTTDDENASFKNIGNRVVALSGSFKNSATTTIQINPTNTKNEGDLTDNLVLKVYAYNKDKRLYETSYDHYMENNGGLGDSPPAEAVSLYQNVNQGYGTVMGQFLKTYTLVP